MDESDTKFGCNKKRGYARFNIETNHQEKLLHKVEQSSARHIEKNLMPHDGQKNSNSHTILKSCQIE